LAQWRGDEHHKLVHILA